MKKINIYIIVAFLSLISFKLSAQQDQMFAHYQFNQLVLNPAYAGSTDYASFTLVSRHQWIGFEGAPSTQSFSVHTPLKKQLGVGIALGRDVSGPMTNFFLETNFSYNLQVGEKSNLLFGLMAGFNNANVMLTELQDVDPDDVTFHNNINAFKPVFGAGLYFSNPKGFISFSVPDLLETDYTDQSVTWLHKRHYFLSGGYLADLGTDVKLRPTAMFRYVQAAPFSAELTLSAIFKERVWFGIIYRLNDAVGALAAVQINPQFRIAYSYDYSTTVLRGYQGGSHEISITYDLNFGEKQHVNPRYF